MPSSYCSSDGKKSWPELIGVDGDVAATTIEKENLAVHAVVVKPHMHYLPVVRCDRVLVFVDANGKVDIVPTVG